MHYDEQNDVARFIRCAALAIIILWAALSYQIARDAIGILFR